MDCSPPDPSVHGDSLGKNTGLGCYFLLQGISSTQESNHISYLGRQILYHWDTREVLSMYAAAAAKSLQTCLTLCDPNRQQPTRLPHPWDSQGKNTGVGCHFLLQCMKLKSESEVAQSFPTLNDPMDFSLSGASIHGIFQARVPEWGAIAFSEEWPDLTANR